MIITESKLRKLIRESLDISEGLRYHVSHNVGIDKNIFRPGSSAFFALFREARQLYKEGKYMISDAERELLEDLDIGEFGYYEGKRVPLDFTKGKM